MRWQEKPKTEIVHRFLFWPTCFDGEYRWLEFASIKRVYQYSVWYECAWGDNESSDRNSTDREK